MNFLKLENTLGNPRPHTSKFAKPKNIQNNFREIPPKQKSRPFSSIKPSRAANTANEFHIDPNSVTNGKSSDIVQKLSDYLGQHQYQSVYSMTANANANINYRPTRPGSSFKDKIFNKYWELPKCGDTGGALGGRNKMEDILTNQFIADQARDSKRSLYKFTPIDWTAKRNFNFLTNVGGMEINLSNNLMECTSLNTTSLTTRPVSGNIQMSSFNRQNIAGHRPLTATENITPGLLSNNNNRIFSSGPRLKPRPVTACVKSKARPLSSQINEMTQSKNIEDNNQIEIVEIREEDLSIHQDSKCNSDTASKNIIKSFPKVESLIRNYEKLNVKTYSIKQQAANTDLLEIFDRSQRTLAATLAKVGDYDYYTPFQRIGSFMNFSSHLKWEDLKSIEKHITQTKNQVGFLQSKHNIQMVQSRMTINNSKYFRDPNSLFHGFMKFEGDMEKYIMELGKNGKTYDPFEFLPKYKYDQLLCYECWPNEFSKAVTTSIANYNKYLDSEKILITDLHPFEKKFLKKRVMKSLEFDLMNHHIVLIDYYIDEAESLYYDIMKRIIMDYILRSPYERKRLNIQYCPQKVLPSSYIISSHGSFNRNLYTDWVENYNTAYHFLEKNLAVCNIVTSGLIDWTQSFQHVNLVYITCLEKLRDKVTETIHVEEFYNIQSTYMMKAMRFLRDIYYRGALLIMKKNKQLKRKSVGSFGRWTFKGFITKENIENYITGEANVSSYETYTTHRDDICAGACACACACAGEMNKHAKSNELFGMEYDDGLDDFWSNVDITDLIDIRVTPSYFAQVTLLQKKPINLSQNEYDGISAEEKIKINTNVTAYCSNFFRSIIEKSVHQFSEFILSFKNLDEIMNTKIIDTQKALNTEIHYKDKELRLPMLKAFSVRSHVQPILSIKTKYDSMYSLIKLEYSLDTVVDYFLKLVDQISTVFNSICFTHFLDFKAVLPTEKEKVHKEHSIKLNEIFLDEKSKSKSFMEDYFINLCPSLIVEEIMTQHSMKTFLRIATPNEEIMSNIKARIYRHVKIHYVDSEECLKVFDPIKELVNNTLGEMISSFLESTSTMLDYNKFSLYVDKIRTIQRYICTIPDAIDYSLFSIDLRETKKELQKKVAEYLNAMMKRLEEIIYGTYSVNIEKYNAITKMIDRKLNTPEEVVEMDQIKSTLSSDISTVIRDFDDAMKIFVFLLKIEHIFSDSLIMKTDEAMKRHFKFKKDSDEIEKMHRQNKDFLENKFREDKKQLEDDLEFFLSEITLLDNETHITEYDKVVNLIISLEDKTDPLKARIDRSLKDEELLFEFMLGGFENYEKAVERLKKLSIMWKHAAHFYNESKKLLQRWTDDLDIVYYLTKFNEIQSIISANKQKLKKEEEVVNKMSKIIEADIESFNEFLTIVNSVIQSPSPMPEELKTKAEEMIESKKLEGICRSILFMYYSKKS